MSFLWVRGLLLRLLGLVRVEETTQASLVRVQEMRRPWVRDRVEIRVRERNL